MLLGVDRNRPGATALLLSLPLSLISFVFVMMYKVPVDDRGETLPRAGFHAVYLQARSMLSGERVRTHNESIFDVVGPGAVLYGLIPLGIVVAAYIAYRRSPNSRPLTFGMLGLAVVVLFTGALGFTFILSLGALAVGSFQARRAEMPARMAARDAARSRAEEDEDDDEEVLDEDEDLEDDEYLDEDEELDDGYEDEYDDEEIVDEDEDVEDEDVDVEGDDEVVAADTDVEPGTDVADEELDTPEPEAEKPASGKRKR